MLRSTTLERQKKAEFEVALKLPISINTAIITAAASVATSHGLSTAGNRRGFIDFDFLLSCLIFTINDALNFYNDNSE